MLVSESTRPQGKLRETAFRHSVNKAGGIEALLEIGYLQIKYDPSVLARNVPVILDGLTHMTESQQDRLDFAADIFGYDEVGWKHDSGLYRRNEREQKWFFHQFKETRDRMKTRGAPVEKYADFFDAMEDLSERALRHAQILAAIFDEYHAAKGRALPYSLYRSFLKGYNVTRGLRYLERAQEKPDATPHFDRDGFTTHWYASRQGLIVRDRKGGKHRVQETEFDTICLFPGKKFGGITAYEYGEGTLHGVIDTARESGATDDRLGLVSFTHPTLTIEEALRIKDHESICEEIENTFQL